jgi:hypothetical protein
LGQGPTEYEKTALPAHAGKAVITFFLVPSCTPHYLPDNEVILTPSMVMRVHILAQYGIDHGLVALSLQLEKLDNIGIYTINSMT